MKVTRKERGYSKSMFVVKGRGGMGPLKANRNEQGEERGQAYLYEREKNFMIFKQQTEFFLINCVAVANSFVVLTHFYV